MFFDAIAELHAWNALMSVYSVDHMSVWNSNYTEETWRIIGSHISILNISSQVLHHLLDHL